MNIRKFINKITAASLAALAGIPLIGGMCKPRNRVHVVRGYDGTSTSDGHGGLTTGEIIRFDGNKWVGTGEYAPEDILLPVENSGDSFLVEERSWIGKDGNCLSIFVSAPPKGGYPYVRAGGADGLPLVEFP